MEKELQELRKMEKKLQKLKLTYYSLLVAQDLWQAHYQILSIIFLKEFIALNVNLKMMIKNVKLAELNTVTVFLSTQLKIINTLEYTVKIE